MAHHLLHFCAFNFHAPIYKTTRTHAAALLCIASMGNALSQNAAPEITITSPLPQQISSFGDAPLTKAPFSAISIDNATLRDIGATRISDALRLDASVTDSYNSPAYWDILNVRGYTLDNRYNYRSEGLPINAETMIPMENKERIELLKGTSGIQAGTSSPGGLANFVVKRAPSANDENMRAVTASYGQGKSSSIALDLGSRLGESKQFGYRLNAAYEDLNPYIQNTQGHRNLLALALDWRLSADSKLDFEFEKSERQQMGVNAYSVLANAANPYGTPSLPRPVSGSQNLTRQAWSVPGVFTSTTGSLRFKQNLGDGWQWTTQYGAQRLRTDDRLSFAFGATLPNGDWLGDRFASNGSFDLYDYRSDNERRLTDAMQTTLDGTKELAGILHRLAFSVMRSRQLDRLESTQLYSYAGTSTGFAGAVPAQVLNQTYYNTNRSEYSNEIAATDRIEISAQTSAWVGLRHTSSDRSTVSLDPSNPNPVKQQTAFTTPWLALSHEYSTGSTVYASYGEGVELFTAPNNANYANAGQFLGAQRSKQVEVGAKGNASPQLRWSAALFHIDRPLAYDYASARVVDGTQTHQGLDAGLQWTQQHWLLSGQAQWLHARISGTTLNIDLNGSQPVNVPALTLRALAQYRWAEIPGLRTSLRMSHEGQRSVLENGNLNLPAWTTWDAAAHYDTRIQGTRTEWTLAIDNLTDQHYWRESPKQFGHYYLYPGAPRTSRLSVRMRF
jgi:iron complex outermembrane receptor protein